MVEAELDFAPRAKLKAACRRIERDPECGKPLGGVLKGCRSIRLEGVTNRLIYRIKELDDVVVCEVIAIGRRRDESIHRIAEKRL